MNKDLKLMEKLDQLINKAKVECYDANAVYHHFDYIDYIDKDDFIEYLELWLEVYEECALCGEEKCNCLEQKRKKNE